MTISKTHYGRHIKPSRFLWLALLLALISNCAFAQSTGTITGTVVDQELGEALIGVNVYIEGTTYGAATDLDGNYTIKGIPAGNYNLVFSMIGFAKLTVTNVAVEAGEVKKIEVTLASEAFETDEVVVTAEAVENTEAALLAKRLKATAVSDAISIEAISRTGSGNAADAVKQITGASVVGGKYVYVRGLGDRYSSTQLNGTELPSADPDKKSFNLDLFPTNLLDNIVTIKSFTPDKPGNFSGGLVDVGTKNYPEKFTLNFSASSSYNTNTTFNNKYLTYDGGNRDWLGYDDGTREIPAALSDPDVEIPTANSARRDKEAAYRLNDLSKAFSNQMSPIRKEAPVNQSYSFSIGNQIPLFNRPLGFIASLSYSRNYQFYENGDVGRYVLSGNFHQAEGLNDYLILNDSKGSDEVLWGGMVNLAYKPHPSHDISAKYMYTQSGEASARYQEGSWRNQLGDGPVYETRTMTYMERNLQTYQFTGEHFFQALLKSTVNWTASFSSTEQNEPDLRFFSDDYQMDEDERIYAININSYNAPTRFFRDLQEDKSSFNLDINLPFQLFSDLSSKFKFGGHYSKSDRSFRERRFEFPVRNNLVDYEGDPVEYFSDENTGIVRIDTASSGLEVFRFGNYVSDQSTIRSNYDGDQEISAGFGMVEIPLMNNLKFITGVRYETTDINVTSQDTLEPKGILRNEDWLPSVNFVYQFSGNMNLRVAYGKTLARPNLRELAPFRSFQFLGDYSFVGNPDLKRTLINNYDLRWEWFQRPGEIYAVSLFYKTFKNPIERTFNPSTFLVQYQNVEKGMTYGAEFELRKNLDQVLHALRNFHLNMNFSLIHSEVDIPTEEYENNILTQDSSASDKRPLYGQSPYLFNVELAYLNETIGTTLSLSYNIFGERLEEVTLGATPDVYEQPRGILDFTLSQKVWQNLKIKFGAKNILNSKVKHVIDFKGTEYLYRQYDTGRTFSLGLSYSL